MGDRRITAEEARTLLLETSPGPWGWSTSDVDGWSVHAATRAVALQPESRMFEDQCHTEADAAILAAAPDLAATVIALHEEVERLLAAIRAHRDERGHDRCWLDDDALYRALPEGALPDTTLPPREEFLRNCERFYAHRQCPEDATYLRHRDETQQLRAERDLLKQVGDEGLLEELTRARELLEWVQLQRAEDRRVLWDALERPCPACGHHPTASESSRPPGGDRE